MSGFIIPRVKEGSTFVETLAEALFNSLRGFPGQYIGFKGLHGIAADIGANDGRYIGLLRNLGAQEVYAIEPLKDRVQTIKERRLLDENKIIACKVEELDGSFYEFFDNVTLLNTEVRRDERAIRAVRDVLIPNGGLLITCPSLEEMAIVKKSFEEYFTDLISTELISYGSGIDGPHRFGLFGRKN